MISNNPKVTVVSVWYNRENYVEESIKSIILQTYQNLEIILWDDCSTDNTYKLLEAYKSEKVNIFRSKKNQGLTKCLIEAIGKANGNLIAIHGSGDISLPKRIEKQVDVFIKREADVVSCLTQRYSESLKKYFKSKDAQDGFPDPKYSPLTHGEVMFSREIYNLAGGYREFFEMSQDYDLWLRMRDEGACFIKVNEFLYQTFSRKEGVSGDYKKMFIQSHYAAMAYQCWIERNKNKSKSDIVQYFPVSPWPFLKNNQVFKLRLLQNLRLSFEKRDLEHTFYTSLKCRYWSSARWWFYVVFTSIDMLITKRFFVSKFGLFIIYNKKNASNS
ncbi:MAG: glycosyltransferase [Opitutales bacterium]|nr:glycosyltransferase [Opitutales bacterium]